MTTVQPAIRGDQLIVRIEDKTLLDGVSLSVRGGELVGVVGPNGAGKTTLLKALSGDLPLDGGEDLH